MSAVLKEEETAVVAEETKVELVPEIKLENDTLIVTFPAEVFVQKATEHGVKQEEIKKVAEFNKQFIKDIVTATGEALPGAYNDKANAAAVKHVMDYSTPLNDINIKGNLEEYSALSKSSNTGLRIGITTPIYGLGAINKKLKKNIFESTRNR